MDSEGDHSPPSKSKPLGCPKQGKEEEQGEKRREKRKRRRRRKRRVRPKEQGGCKAYS